MYLCKSNLCCNSQWFPVSRVRAFFFFSERHDSINPSKTTSWNISIRIQVNPWYLLTGLSRMGNRIHDNALLFEYKFESNSACTFASRCYSRDMFHWWIILPLLHLGCCQSLNRFDAEMNVNLALGVWGSGRILEYAQMLAQIRCHCKAWLLTQGRNRPYITGVSAACSASGLVLVFPSMQIPSAQFCSFVPAAPCLTASY